MKQRGALDDGNSPMSRREIRALRREFAKLDRLGVGQHETLDHVPEQVSPSSVTGASTGRASKRGTGTPAQSGGSSMSVGEALGRLRWSVVFLGLVGVLMTIATVAPAGWNRTESVPASPNPSTAPAAPLDPANPYTSTDSPPSRFGAPSETPTPSEFTFRGPFGP